MAQPALAAFDSGSTTTNASSYTTTSLTFVAGRLYVIFFGATSASSINDPTVFKYTTNGTAWTKIRTDGTTQKTGVYVIKGLAVTDTVTITFGAQSITGLDWIIFEVTGYRDTGSIAGSIPQSNNATGTSTTPSVALPAPPIAGNLTVGFVLQGANAAFTAGTNFTKVTETAGHTVPAARAAGEKDNGTAQQTTDWTITSAGWFATVIEIDAVRTSFISGDTRRVQTNSLLRR